MAKIAIFAGHGGSDPGAVYGEYIEKKMNLDVALAATKVLKQWGYTVINNRTTDVSRSITADANLANSNKVDAVVEIHQNSSAGESVGGSEVFYSIKDTGVGKRLATAILKKLVSLGFRDRGIKTMVNASGQDMLGILRLTNSPAVLVECAFVNSKNDMKIFDVNKIGLAIAEGIREIFPISGGSGSSYPGYSIRIGARGDFVSKIQKCLNNISSRYSSIIKLSEDGIFGANTEKAVKEFQRIFGLYIDGIVGINTWDKIMRECSQIPAYPGVLIKRGSTGNDVIKIQSCLNRLSSRYSSIQRLTEDGIFGANTEKAVKEFQRIFGLYIDGIVGINTWQRLMDECARN